LTQFLDEKWEVLIRSGGRESQRIRRRYDRKVDAQLFLADFKKKNQLLEVSSEFSNPEETTLTQEADFWLTHSEARFRYC
jgi:predicted transcriptional regulator